MSSSALITVLVVLFGLLLIGSPVVMAIGTAAMSYFLIKPDMLGNLMMYAHRLFTGMDSFIYICIPLFMLSGELMGYTGLMDRVVDFCRIFVGRLRGGVAYVNVLSSMIGLITPPFGVGLYTAASVSGCELKRIVKASLPFTAACVTVLFLITYIPGFALTLPRLVGYTI